MKKLRSSDISLEIVQFYPDTLMNLECLILFKYERTSKLIQFENFFEIKATKFEYVHKYNNKDANVDFKIYGGGDRKVYIGGGNIIIKHSLFNHSSVKSYVRNYTCILTQGGKDFLFPCKRPDNDNASIRLEIVIKNNNLLKAPISDTLGKMVIVNQLENDDVNIKNDSQNSADNSKKNLNFTRKVNEWSRLEQEIDEKKKNTIVNEMNKMSPISKKAENFNFNIEKFNLVNDNLEELNEDIKEDLLYEDNSHFDSFFENPELYYRSDYPTKKDLSETKSKQDQKNVLIHDLYGFKDLYYEKFKRMRENTVKLRMLMNNYKFQLFKMKKKYNKLCSIRELTTDANKSLNIVNSTQVNLLKKQKEINANLFDFFKKTFKIKYNKIDILKSIQSKYKEKDIKEVLIKVMKLISLKSLKLLTKEKLSSFMIINKKYDFIKVSEILEVTCPKTFKMDENFNDNKLSQEEFDKIYKNKKVEVMAQKRRSSSKRKSTIRKSVLISSSKNTSYINDMTNDNKFNELHQLALQSKYLDGNNFVTKLTESSEEIGLIEYIDEWLVNNPDFKPFEIQKLSSNLYKINNVKLVIETETLDNSINNYFAITQKEKLPLDSFLVKVGKKFFKNLNKNVSLNYSLLKEKEKNFSTTKSFI